MASMKNPQLTLRLIKAECIPPKISNNRGCLLIPLPFNIVLQALERVIRQEKEVKVIQTGKTEAKLSLFTDEMILYM